MRRKNTHNFFSRVTVGRSRQIISTLVIVLLIGLLKYIVSNTTNKLVAAVVPTVAIQVAAPSDILSLKEVFARNPSAQISPDLIRVKEKLLELAGGSKRDKSALGTWWGRVGGVGFKQCSSCVHLGRGNGGKWLLGNPTPKVVYSLGSNNDFSFEEDIMKMYSPETHTFDCYITLLKEKVPTKVQFHPWCLGLDNKQMAIHGKKATFRKLTDVIKELGHEQVDVLKMDIEGSEFDVLDDILNMEHKFMPRQLLVEVHLMAWVNTMWRLPPSTPQDLSKLFKHYDIINVEPNVHDEVIACEYVFLRK